MSPAKHRNPKLNRATVALLAKDFACQTFIDRRDIREVLADVDNITKHNDDFMPCYDSKTKKTKKRLAVRKRITIIMRLMVDKKMCTVSDKLPAKTTNAMVTAKECTGWFEEKK